MSRRGISREGSANVTGSHTFNDFPGRRSIAWLVPSLSHDVSVETGKSRAFRRTCAATVPASKDYEEHPCRLGPLANGFCRFHGGVV